MEDIKAYKEFTKTLDDIKYTNNKDYTDQFKMLELRMYFNDQKEKLPNEFIKRFICYTINCNMIQSDNLYKMFVSANPLQYQSYDQFLQKMISILNVSDYKMLQQQNYRMEPIGVDMCMTCIDSAVCRNYMIAKDIYEQFESEYNDQLVYEYFQDKHVTNK